MNCREFVEFMLEYFDGHLSDAERQAFQSHIEACPPCGTYLDTYGETIKLGKDALCPSDGSLPEEVPEGLVQAILAARRTSS